MGDLARELAGTDRAKKKKKKPQGMSKGLLYGLIGGGAGAVILIIVLIIAFSGGGGSDKKGGPGDPKKDPVAGYVRPMKEAEALGKLQAIGLAYHNYVSVKKKGPAEVRQLDAFYEKDAAEFAKMYDGGSAWIDLMVNWMPTTLTEGSSKTIVAYEKQPFEGKRVVLYGDARSAAITEEEFEKSPRVSPEGKTVAGPLVVEGGKTRLGKYVRPLERLEMETTLKNLGLAYVQFELERNRGPKEFAELGLRDVNTVGALGSKDGWLFFIWGAGRRDMPEGPERTILAYERESVRGERYVLFGNGSFAVMTDEEFAKAPKARGK